MTASQSWQICSSRSLALDQPRAERAQISGRPLKSGKYLQRSTPTSADSYTASLPHNFRNRAAHNQPQRSRHSNPHNARRTTNVSLPAVSSLGGLRTPAPLCAAPPSWGRHPKTFTTADIRAALHLNVLPVAARGSVPVEAFGPGYAPFNQKPHRFSGKSAPSQWCAGDLHQPLKRLTQLQDQGKSPRQPTALPLRPRRQLPVSFASIARRS